MMVTAVFSPGGFPTSGSMSAGRRRVGRAAPIHLFESFHLTFDQLSSKLSIHQSIPSTFYVQNTRVSSLTTHQFIRDTLWPM